MRKEALRLPLLANAAFSLATGLIMALRPAIVGQWLGPEIDWLYAFLGIGLILFAVALGVMAIRPTALQVLAVSAADLFWVLSTMLALIIWNVDFTPSGIALVLAINLVVATIAWFQLRSIRNAYRSSEAEGNEYDVCIAVEAPVDQAAFWRVLADLGAIERYSPALKSSDLTQGERPGPGCVRTCENIKGQVWSERCIAWEEGQAFDLEFLADEPGFPYPFSRMRGGWRLRPATGGCEVEVWWRVVPHRAWATALLLPLMEASARRFVADTVARMALAATGASPGIVRAQRLSAPLRAMAC